jgi:hypothetical protein
LAKNCTSCRGCSTVAARRRPLPSGESEPPSGRGSDRRPGGDSVRRSRRVGRNLAWNWT